MVDAVVADAKPSLKNDDNDGDFANNIVDLLRHKHANISLQVVALSYVIILLCDPMVPTMQPHLYSEVGPIVLSLHSSSWFCFSSLPIF